ncbi:glycosyltransferase family 4 protein [Gemmata sp. JC673]|uniref:Glycosyltransferase family 4 protein n=1 Tax=Gemmata algarum TaxID=2975278 RepID=A0ABU5EYV2_9BACT|nr:glycosyltransferase family 4 protein [Gemmata algarum]MDY3558988.1 glycosyltransferase family 4 protein [Gemmata algarum]
MTAKPRVLAATSEPPWPLNSGGHIRSFHLMKALAAATDFRLVCPVGPDQAASVEALQKAGIAVRPAAVPARSKWSEAKRLLGAALKAEPYVMYRRHAWAEAARVWEHELKTAPPDVLYLDHLDGLLYRAAAPAVPAVIDLHNVYSLLVRRTAEEQTSPLKGAFLQGEAKRLDRAERRAARECDALFAVSDTEAGHFRALGAKAVHTVPNGVDCAALADLPTGRGGPPVVMFLGTMSWGPNAAAARFLARDVLPALRARVPDAVLAVVGRDPPADLLALNGSPGIEVTGGVPDVKPYLLRASALAVPLDAGGGTRLKILEAFAAGLPVVSTAVGAEGIAAEPGTHFVLAERPAFADATAKLLADAVEGARMAERARELARATYDWPQIGRKAAEVVAGLARSL